MKTKQVFILLSILAFSFMLSACGQKNSIPSGELGPILAEEDAVYHSDFGGINKSGEVVMSDVACKSMGAEVVEICSDGYIEFGKTDNGLLCCALPVLLNSSDSQDQEGIKNKIIEVYEAEDVELKFIYQTNNHVKGEMKLSSPILSGLDEEYFPFYAVRVADNWEIIFNGAENVPCTWLEPYVFPPYVAQGCEQ